MMTYSFIPSLPLPLPLPVFLFALLCGNQVVVSRAYLLMGNGNVYTVDESNPTAEAIAVEEGVIVGVGTADEIRSELGTESDFWDLNGRLVLPGFMDSHLHVVEAGIYAGTCFIPEGADLYDIAFYFESCNGGGKFGDQGWIVGAGIDIATLLDTVWELNYDWPITVLDKAFPDVPVLILDNLGHGAVANTRALEESGLDLYSLDVNDDDPPGGKMDRDPDTGEFTGVVLENAQQALRNKAFPPTEANQEVAYKSLLQAMELLVAYGITTVSDAGGFWKQAQTESWARAESEGKLQVRASNSLYIYPEVGIGEQLSVIQSRLSNDKTKLLRFNQAKIYVDGILSLTTSALFAPYLSSLELPTNELLGFEYFGNQSSLQAVADAVVEAGFQLNMHVTGDRGAAIALDTIQNLKTPGEGPHRLTHCYLVDKTDRPRFQALNVVADFQLAPSSLTSSYQKFIADVILGDERANELLPAKEVHEAGGLVTLSSDWDADELNPLTKLKVVLTRPDGKAIPDIDTAIRMMTINAAISLQHEAFTGSIQVGKYADAIVLSQNILEMAAESIDKAEVLLTMMNGELTYDPDGMHGPPLGERPNTVSRASQQFLPELTLFVAIAVNAVAICFVF